MKMQTFAAQSIPEIFAIAIFALNAAGSTPPQVRCPQCGEMSVWSPENRWRPFCSERCKLIDLGCWADESYRVAAEEAAAPAADDPPLPPRD